MPAVITHHIFGEKAAGLLPPGTVRTQEELIAFLLGNQGPDPLFFRWRGSIHMSRRLRILGSALHGKSVGQAFVLMRECMGRMDDTLRPLGRAFCLGFLGHYALDSTTHPFIYAEERDLVEASEGALAGDERQVHSIIESDLDSWMLWRERGRTVLEDPPAAELVHTPEVDLAAGAVLCQVAWQVYDVAIPVEAYGRCVSDMQAFYRIIEPAGSPAGRALGRIERTLRQTSSILEAHAHPVIREDACPLANPDHLPWSDPETGEVSKASFMDCFNEALGIYPSLAAAWLDGGEGLPGWFERNYSGKGDPSWQS